MDPRLGTTPLTLIRKAITPDRPSSAGVSGAETFRRLLRLISSHFDRGDWKASFNRLHNFGVSNGTPFSDFFLAFQVVFLESQALSRYLLRVCRQYWNWFVVV